MTLPPPRTGLVAALSLAAGAVQEVVITSAGRRRTLRVPVKEAGSGA